MVYPDQRNSGSVGVGVTEKDLGVLQSARYLREPERPVQQHIVIMEWQRAVTLDPQVWCGTFVCTLCLPPFVLFCYPCPI